LFIPIDYNDFN